MSMKKIRHAMVGGGTGAFIGEVHRIASRIDGHYELVAGALSSTPEKSKLSGAELGLEPDRCYGSFEEMAKVEAAREDGIEVVSIVTPNHLHASAAKAFLAQGIHVICDKPLTTTMAEAEDLSQAVAASDALFVLTHNYTAYPVIRQAREMILGGAIGKIRVAHGEYLQDWMTESIELAGSKQAVWRNDPKRAGVGGSISDIGTHAHNLLQFVTGLEVTSLAADLHRFGTNRALDDNAHILLRFNENVRGTLCTSQVAPGNENGLKIRIYGEKGGIEWSQENPNHLWYTPFGQTKQLITRAGAGATNGNIGTTRTPAGHPEGYLEGFANIYKETAVAIRAVQAGKSRQEAMGLLPDIKAGISGMSFVLACVRSHEQDAKWVAL